MSGGNKQPIASMRMRMDDYRPPRAERLLRDPKEGLGYSTLFLFVFLFCLFHVLFFFVHNISLTLTLDTILYDAGSCCSSTD